MSLAPRKLKSGCLKLQRIEPIIPDERRVISHSFDYDKLIMFRPTGVCNYRCEYCYWREQEHPHLETVIDTVNMIQKTFPKEKMLYYFHGGESTTYPDLPAVIKHVNTFKNTQIELQTNGSQSLEYYKNLEENLNIDCYSISYHHAQCKDFEKFLEVVDYVFELGKLENVDIMFPPTIIKDEDLERFKDNTRKLLKFGKHVEVTYGYGCGYSGEAEYLFDFYQEIEPLIHAAEYNVKLHNGSKAVFNKSELFSIGVDCKGMACNAMRDYIAVDGAGNFAPCGTYFLQGNEGRKRVFNMLEDPKLFQIMTKNKTICKENYCSGEWYLIEP